MASRILLTQKCRIGDILAEDIYNKYGSVVTVKNTIVTPFIKEKLMGMGIFFVKVYDSSKEVFHHSDAGSKKIAEDHKLYVSNLKEIICELSTRGTLNFKKLDTICDSMLDHKKELSPIIKFLSTIKSHDNYTYHHSINVAFYCMLIAKWLKLSEAETKAAVLSGLLHDIGKTKIPDHILNKPGALLADEYNEIKKHSQYGYDILKEANNFSEEICKAVLQHHEREDGSGYPFGVKGIHIDKFAKIITVADVYDAMISNRVYKKAACPFSVFEMFQNEGLKIFDINIIMTFSRNISPYFISSKVSLIDGSIGEIVYIPPNDITKPIIRIGTQFIDLFKETGSKIFKLANLETIY